MELLLFLLFLESNVFPLSSAAAGVKNKKKTTHFPLAQIPKFQGSDPVGLPYLNVLPEEVGVKTQPVPRNVEASLQEDVSEESAGVHWEQKRRQPLSDAEHTWSVPKNSLLHVSAALTRTRFLCRR